MKWWGWIAYLFLLWGFPRLIGEILGSLTEEFRIGFRDRADTLRVANCVRAVYALIGTILLWSALQK